MTHLQNIIFLGGGGVMKMTIVGGNDSLVNMITNYKIVEFTAILLIIYKFTIFKVKASGR